jgi:hypothetical protein
MASEGYKNTDHFKKEGTRGSSHDLYSGFFRMVIRNRWKLSFCGGGL